MSSSEINLFLVQESVGNILPLAPANDVEEAASVPQNDLSDASGTNNTLPTQRRMAGAVAAKNEANAPVGASRAAAVGDLPPPPNQFPAPPSLPPSGAPDSSVPSTDEYNYSQTGYINKIWAFYRYISANPGDTQGYLNFAEYISNLSQDGLMNSDVEAVLNEVNAGDLMKVGIDQATQFAFLMGYGGNPPGMASYDAYLTAMQNALTAIKGVSDNSYIDAMLSEVTSLQDPSNRAQFQSEHVNADGSIFWNVNGDTYNWVTPNPATNSTEDQLNDFMIEQIIQNSGLSGAPNQQVAYLNSKMGTLMTQDLVNTLNQVWNEYHDPGLLILALMQGLDNDYLGQEGGNANIMDYQHQMVDKQANPLQSLVSSIGSWDPSGSSSAHDLRLYLRSMIDLVNSSGQFSAIQPSMTSLITTLKSTSIAFPPGQSNTTASLYDILISGQTGNPPTPITDAEAQSALVAAFGGQTPTPPSGGSTPSYNTPSADALQGFLGAINGVTSAVSSSSTELNTQTAQIEQLHQAILKLGTGVVDPRNGLMAVVMAAINNQTKA